MAPIAFEHGRHTRLHAGETPPGIKRQAVYQTTDKTTDNQEHVGPLSVDPDLEVPGHTSAHRQFIGNGILVLPGQRDICAAAYGPKTAFFGLVVIEASLGRGIANTILVDQMARVRFISRRGSLHSDETMETMTGHPAWVR